MLVYWEGKQKMEFSNHHNPKLLDEQKVDLWWASRDKECGTLASQKLMAHIPFQESAFFTFQHLFFSHLIFPTIIKDMGRCFFPPPWFEISPNTVFGVCQLLVVFGHWDFVGLRELVWCLAKVWEKLGLLNRLGSKPADSDTWQFRYTP